MIRYHFDAVNGEGQKVGGVLFAEDEQSARSKLMNNGYAILSIEERAETLAAESHLSVFEFRGKNESDVFVQGTIQGNDPYEAYKKLRSQYKLELDYLLPVGLSTQEKNEFKAKGINPDIVELYDEEFDVVKNNKKKKKNTKKNKNDLVRLSKKRQDKIDFYHLAIEKVIQDGSVMLQKLEGKIESEKYREIKAQLDILARLRASNSIEHLDSLVRKLFRKFRDIQEDEAVDLKVRNLIGKEMMGMNSKFDAGLKTTDLNLSFVNTDKVKRTLRDLRIWQNLLTTFYWVCFFLGIFSVAALLVILVKSLFMDIDHFLFFIRSGTYMFFLSFSFLVVGLYYPFIKPIWKWDNKQQYLYMGVTALVWVIYGIEFPVIFFWT